MLLSKISGKRLAAAMLAACLTPYLAGAPAYAAGEEIAWPKRLIVSAPASGTPAGMIMASIARVIEKNTPIQRVIVQPIGGINNFAPMMEKGEVDIAIHSGADVLAHMAGLEKNRMGDARRENLPPGGVITLPERPLHICQQNYKNEGRGKNPSPCFHALRRCLVKAGSHVAARSSCGTARGFFPPARRETA